MSKQTIKLFAVAMVLAISVFLGTILTGCSAKKNPMLSASLFTAKVKAKVADKVTGVETLETGDIKPEIKATDDSREQKINTGDNASITTQGDTNSTTLMKYLFKGYSAFATVVILGLMDILRIKNKQMADNEKREDKLMKAIFDANSENAKFNRELVEHLVGNLTGKGA